MFFYCLQLQQLLLLLCFSDLCYCYVKLLTISVHHCLKPPSPFIPKVYNCVLFCLISYLFLTSKFCEISYCSRCLICRYSRNLNAMLDKYIIGPYGLFMIVGDAIGTSLAWPCLFISLVRED